MFFQGWEGLGRTAAVGALAYLSLVLFLRLSGKRTLTKMNAFDLVVTVALGSTLATVLLSKDVALAEGLTGFATLILLQYAVAWLSVRSSAVERVVKAEPALVFHQGRYLHSVLRRERVTPEEVRAAVRKQGLGGLDAVQAVVLETDGSMTVIAQSKLGDGQAIGALPAAPSRTGGAG